MSTPEQNPDESWRGKVGRLGQDELDEFLAEGNIGRLGVLDNEGWPYVVPIWYQFAEGGFYVIPRERSHWADYMVNDNRVYLTIDVPGSLKKVMVRGRAELIERPNVGGKWVAIAEDMSRRYLGPDGPSYLVPTLTEPRWLFFVHADKVTTWQGVDWAKKYKHDSWGANEG